MHNSLPPLQISIDIQQCGLVYSRNYLIFGRQTTEGSVLMTQAGFRTTNQDEPFRFKELIKARLFSFVRFIDLKIYLLEDK